MLNTVMAFKTSYKHMRAVSRTFLIKQIFPIFPIFFTSMYPNIPTCIQHFYGFLVTEFLLSRFPLVSQYIPPSQDSRSSYVLVDNWVLIALIVMVYRSGLFLSQISASGLNRDIEHCPGVLKHHTHIYRLFPGHLQSKNFSQCYPFFTSILYPNVSTCIQHFCGPLLYGLLLLLVPLVSHYTSPTQDARSSYVLVYKWVLIAVIVMPLKMEWGLF